MCSQRWARLENFPPKFPFILIHPKQISVVSKSDKQKKKKERKKKGPLLISIPSLLHFKFVSSPFTISPSFPSPFFHFPFFPCLSFPFPPHFPSPSPFPSSPSFPFFPHFPLPKFSPNFPRVGELPTPSYATVSRSSHSAFLQFHFPVC